MCWWEADPLPHSNTEESTSSGSNSSTRTGCVTGAMHMWPTDLPRDYDIAVHWRLNNYHHTSCQTMLPISYRRKKLHFFFVHRDTVSKLHFSVEKTATTITYVATLNCSLQMLLFLSFSFCIILSKITVSVDCFFPLKVLNFFFKHML